jgi:hypothetical protein
MSLQDLRVGVAAETTNENAEQKVGNRAAIALLALGGMLTLAWIGLLGTFATYLIGLML